MVPGVYEWGRRSLRASALAAACLVPALAFAAPAAARGLADVVYEFAVTGYCGSQTPEVEAGFRKELARLTAASGVDAETARRQRIQGWIAAENEWRNRGLGGQRAWCAAEGDPAARHFRSIAREP
ncbi:MAG: hypothetical protein Kow00114_15760 [Kiloniellaceae bacterium]